MSFSRTVLRSPRPPLVIVSAADKAELQPDNVKPQRQPLRTQPWRRHCSLRQLSSHVLLHTIASSLLRARSIKSRLHLQEVLLNSFFNGFAQAIFLFIFREDGQQGVQILYSHHHISQNTMENPMCEASFFLSALFPFLKHFTMQKRGRRRRRKK